MLHDICYDISALSDIVKITNVRLPSICTKKTLGRNIFFKFIFVYKAFKQ